MNREMLDILNDSRKQASEQAQCVLVSEELLEFSFNVDYELIQRTAAFLEIAVLDLLSEEFEEDSEHQTELRLVAADTFRLFRALPRPDDKLEAGIFLLRAGALSVLGDRGGGDAARWFRKNSWPELPVESQDWSERTWATVVDVWLRLIRKDGWSDRDLVLDQISNLRKVQAVFEKEHLENLKPSNAKATALELIGLYHLAKAAEIFAHYMTDGVVDGDYQIQELLDTHFDRVLSVCKQARMIELEPLALLLSVSASQMAKSSV